MTEFAPGLKKPNDESTDLEQRDVRALTEYMTTLPLGGDVYSVTTESGSEYRVDAQKGRCTCPDHKHRDVRCKHIRRVSYATGETPIPAWADTDAVAPRLGEHCDDSPQLAAADGGSLAGGDASEENPRSECWCNDRDLACFQHFEPVSTE